MEGKEGSRKCTFFLFPTPVSSFSLLVTSSLQRLSFLAPHFFYRLWWVKEVDLFPAEFQLHSLACPGQERRGFKCGALTSSSTSLIPTMNFTRTCTTINRKQYHQQYQRDKQDIVYSAIMLWIGEFSSFLHQLTVYHGFCITFLTHVFSVIACAVWKGEGNRSSVTLQ